MTSRREQIEALLAEAGDLEDRFRSWQESDPPPDAVDVRNGHRAYMDWYTRALNLVPDGNREQFIDMFEGGQVISRIRGFLSNPLARNPFYDPSQPSPILDPWQHPFDRTFRDNLVVQRGILVGARNAEADISAVLDQIAEVFRRLPEYLATITRAANEHVPAPTIEHETDLQTVVLAVLRLMFDDVRAEDPVPQAAGGSSRVDFLLREPGILVETKMTRPGLRDRRLGEELLVDWGRYPAHPECRAIFALVYDPARHLDNVAALEHDLSQPQGDPPTRVLVIR